MKIATFFGLMAIYAVLSQLKLNQIQDPLYRIRTARREEILERHARWKKWRKKQDVTEIRDSTDNSCCA